MPTANRREFVSRAVEYFLRQDYGPKELIVVDDGEDAVGDLMPADARVRYVRLDQKLTVGAKRNVACELTRGEIIAHWDDDDWSAPRRLSYQVGELLREGADACGIRRLLFYDVRDGRAWRYEYPVRERVWLSGSSICYRRALWERNRFQEINVGEDARFVWARHGGRLHVLADSTFHVGIIHAGNVSPKRTGGAYWGEHASHEVRALLGDDAEFYERFARGACEGSVRRANAHAVASNRAARAQAEEARAEERKAVPPSDLAASIGAATGGVSARGVGGRQGRGGSRGAALVSAAYGVGDILRVTPLVRVFARLGYEVDVLVAPDYAETASLLEGAPEVRRLYVYEDFRKDKALARAPAGLGDETYDVAAFTVWGAPLKRLVRARRVFEFEQRAWLREGDSASVERIARAAGWEGEMPAPFAVGSGRRFGLKPGTMALHPGCKPDWPWKKWHGFDELARLLPEVVVVGTASDLDNAGTYFGRDFEWPAHARSFVGELTLRDTAALLSECAALVSNDSGLMHLGIAVGTETFGVFGITSPARECLASPRMHVVSRGLDCEPACRAKQWGRRDCERHLECLKTLTANDVLARVRAVVPAAAGRASEGDWDVAGAGGVVTVETGGAASATDANVAAASALGAAEAAGGSTALSAVVAGAKRAGEGGEMEELSLVYYGYVFAASGYGHAARAYVHALHSAGVNLSVVDLAAQRPRQVHDELVESLTGRQLSADFHLFHGVPPQWARYAFRLPNAIGMTVWETDAMPSQWRNALNHVVEVWLPCEQNVEVFRRALERPVFKLPHPHLPARSNGDRVEPRELLGVADTDFVFYSLFEWQERKCPEEMIETFLREFAGDADAVLLLKTNPGAAQAAVRAVEDARARTNSRARVEVRAEGWSEAQVEALHERGDCYVSLHRGEGWCCPLFEAAARGTPVVATAFGGPLEYLNAEDHNLVRCRPVGVRQSYVYYHPSMRWAEPDFAHAAELMRAVFRDPKSARERAARAAGRVRGEFSLEAVGRSARANLSELLRRTQPRKWVRVAEAERVRALTPPAPVPANWYDADYFEHGRKSNWDRGYTWELFGDLFNRTAEFLAETFSDAGSFLDAGCARGFLVRALRERGCDARGFDHSPWAFERADESARPYVELAGVDDFEFGAGCDVLTAFSLFECLTEEQARGFLTRARAHTRQALFAVIASFETDEAREAYRARSRDLSQITLRPRAWWHELFLSAGWRQSALGRVAERACRAHELPRRMGWEVYVYAPD